jgi:hypothetical protein
VGLGYFVRTATIEDLNFIQDELVAFTEFYESSLFMGCVKTEYGTRFITNLIEQHIFFICERDGIKTGFITGFISQHMFNPEKSVLTEVFWWVKPEFRSGRSGYLLLKAFKDAGSVFDWCIMTIEDKSPVKPESIKAMGFKYKEMNFMMENT